MSSAPIVTAGTDPNVYYSPEFISYLKKDFLPHAILWTELLLGDLGRHGSSIHYQKQHMVHAALSAKVTQVYIL